MKRSEKSEIATAAFPPPTFRSFCERTAGFRLHPWQREHLVPALESLVAEQGQRVLIHAPPQFGKSILVSKRFPAWALGIKPHLRIVLAGYNFTHAAQFCEVVRDIMNGPDHVELFPAYWCRLAKPAARDAFSTLARAKMRDGQDSLTAVGLLSGFTGKGADILLIDDPYASPDDARSPAINERVWRWWNELAKVRINDRTNVLVMFHRYHEDDFAGRLLAEGGWKYLRFPAVADENEDGSDPTGRKPGELLSPMRSPEFLKEIEDRDPMVWLGQFQGRPRAPEGAFIKREWLREISAADLPPLTLWVRFWDLATKSDQTGDFVSGALLGVGPDQTIYLRDVVRFRAEWPDARDIIAETTRQDAVLCEESGASYEVGIEQVAWMRPMTQDLLTMPIFQKVRLTTLRPTRDKKERASGWVARAKNGLFLLVRDAWNSEFIQECLAFDGLEHTHDDQVDSVSGCYELIWDLKGGVVQAKPVPQIGSYAWIKELIELNRPPRDEYWDSDWDSEPEEGKLYWNNL